jgi:hypothetical protein
MSYNLEARFDPHKSFYGKAIVFELSQGRLILKSYDKEVADISNGVAKVYGIHSKTTLRHIKEFLRQNGFKAASVNQILADYYCK